MDKEHFKDVLKEYCIQEGFYVVVVKADSKRYTAECATLNYDWRIHASILPDGITWAIKNIRSPGHGCAGVRDHNPMATSDWVAKKLLPNIRANTSITGQSIQDLLLESYAHCTWVYMDTPERLPQFKSIFISFNAQIQGVIAGCRSLIGVDGTHLKGNHGGVLLTAVALDGNNEIFPLAVSVVESENKDSWSSFFLHLKNTLKDSGGDNWTVISDRQKGVEPALNNVWPEAYRRFCARHLCKNFKADYPGVLMNKLFWRVVNATSEFSFKKALELIVQHGGRGAARWLLDLGDKELWTKHMFDPTICAEDNTSNFVESFNSILGIHRTNPVLSLLEGIRRLGMVRHATRQHITESWDDNGVCPNILTRLKKLTKDSRGCTTFFSAPGEYEVKDGETYLPVMDPYLHPENIFMYPNSDLNEHCKALESQMDVYGALVDSKYLNDPHLRAYTLVNTLPFSGPLGKYQPWTEQFDRAIGSSDEEGESCMFLGEKESDTCEVIEISDDDEEEEEEEVDIMWTGPYDDDNDRLQPRQQRASDYEMKDDVIFVKQKYTPDPKPRKHKWARLGNRLRRVI
ncbi:uncharacterized protein LOC141607897 [Silene latifolia]|uniref:uncharacterized protein LOC141607897 n=1 Tax=Silene latifolia TaxID=37657 RepID=UPI003D76B140